MPISCNFTAKYPYTVIIITLYIQPPSLFELSLNARSLQCVPQDSKYQPIWRKLTWLSGKNYLTWCLQYLDPARRDGYWWQYLGSILHSQTPGSKRPWKSTQTNMKSLADASRSSGRWQRMQYEDIIEQPLLNRTGSQKKQREAQ